MRPLILLSNDDGYRAVGIMAVREAMLEWADVVVCAPDAEQSAASHALSINRPLRLYRHGNGIFSIDGTPADSIYLALNLDGLLPKRPDLVVSGMNHGLNLGRDVFYSGTVAAAREGALSGIVSLAVSASRETELKAAAALASRIARTIHESGLGGSRLFNVNFPAGNHWDVRATRLGERIYSGGMVQRSDPRGVDYYWIGGSGHDARHEDVPGSDTEAHDAGVVGITPLVLDLWSSNLEPDARLIADRLREKERA